MGKPYDVLTQTQDKLEVRVAKDITPMDLIRALMLHGDLTSDLASNIDLSGLPSWLSADSTMTINVPAGALLPSLRRAQMKERKMAKRLMDTLVKQYAPDADTAWAWMRQAHEMGWEWGNHVLGGISASDPLGQRVAKTVATAFSNDAGIYVGICLVAGAIRWGWFRAEEWGPRGRDLVLAGNRLHHETPIAAISEFLLLGEDAPRIDAPLDDVLGRDWDA